VTREIPLGALRFSAADAFAGFYKLAELRRQTQSVWEHIDCLVVPTIPTVVTLDEIAADPIGPNSRLGTYTNFVNLLDLCGLAVPGPWRADGRPAGVTLLAPAGQDALLAGFASAFHVEADVSMGATGAALPPSSIAPPRVADDLIELAVVGAHLSGAALRRRPATGSTRSPAARRRGPACCALRRRTAMPSRSRSGR
jgi:allophanate hydrolase